MKKSTETKKKKCEVKLHRSCNDSCVTLVRGPKVTDPSGYVCIGCLSDLRRQGVRLRSAEVATKAKKTK